MLLKRPVTSLRRGLPAEALAQARLRQAAIILILMTFIFGGIALSELSVND